MYHRLHTLGLIVDFFCWCGGGEIDCMCMMNVNK